jgi:hypothetical protein
MQEIKIVFFIFILLGLSVSQAYSQYIVKCLSYRNGKSVWNESAQQWVKFVYNDFEEGSGFVFTVDWDN